MGHMQALGHGRNITWHSSGQPRTQRAGVCEEPVPQQDVLLVPSNQPGYACSNG